MRILFCSLLLAVASIQSSSQTAALTASLDNTLYQTGDGSTSNGAGEFLFVGRTNNGSLRRALLKFDVSSAIPAGATVTSASLRLNMSKTASTTARPVSVYRVTAEWGQGTSDAGSQEGSGAASATNDATWIHRFFPSTNWTTPGGDRAVTPSGALDVGATGTYTWTSTSQFVADVQDWLNNPSTNFGWILIGDEETNQSAKRFDSRENGTAANRPQLTIQYTTSTSVAESHQVPRVVTLEGNFPNPFNPSTRIAFSLPSEARARLTIFNVLGVHMTTLVDGPMAAGRHSATWNADGLPSGIYFARLEADGTSTIRRMVLAK